VSDSSHPDMDSTKLERGARILRQAILRGELQPGQQLKQQELAAHLGMSSTPVREVLRILEAEGLIERVPYQGVYVADVSPEEAAEITPIRAVLEGFAVQLGVPRLTGQDIETLEVLNKGMEVALGKTDFAQVRRLNYDFHTTIYQAAGNPTLVNIIERLWPRFATNLLWMIPGRARRSIQQHHVILGAIREGDSMRAATLVSEHIHTAGSSIIDFLKSQQAAAYPNGSMWLGTER
jgi:DNA-binding GntR family transcriptional regulator